VLVGGLDENGKVVEERLLGRARIPRMKLDPGTADFDARRAGPTGRSGVEAERDVLAGGFLRVAREERDVVEVVLDVGLGLDETEPDAFAADVEVDGAVRPVERDVAGKPDE